MRSLFAQSFSHLGTEKERRNGTNTLERAPCYRYRAHFVHPDLPDPDDNRLLEVAIEANADLIVTGDKAVLSLGSIHKPIAIDSLSGSPWSPTFPL